LKFPLLLKDCLLLQWQELDYSENNSTSNLLFGLFHILLLSWKREGGHGAGHPIVNWYLMNKN